MPIPADQFLTEEQVAIQQLAHEFAEKEIRPVAMKLDHMPDPQDSFYMPHLGKQFHEVGLHAMSIPEEFGGGGIDDLFTHSLVAEELGWGDRAVVGLLLSSNKITRYMMARELTTPEQCRKWLTAYAKDPEFLIAQCMTEDEAGSENLLPYNGTDGGFRTTAVREGDYYIVNGRKRFISNAGFAKLYFMYVRTDKTKGINEGSTLLMIPIDTPGLSFGRVHDKMGYRLNLNREIIMENCKVPMANRLGPENYGISKINSHLRAGDGLINAAAMIGNRDKMPVDLKMPGSASMFAHEMSCHVTRDAMEIFGGSGVMRELPIEMYLRNAYNMLHSDGGIIMKKLKVMRQLNLEADADINLD